MLSNLQFVLMLLVPILTMKLISEERRSKTDQMLLTSPVSLWAVVLGKFFAACSVFALTLILSLGYVIILDVFGSPAYNEVIAGYIGLFLLGCALIAVGVFTSAITENQVTSAVLGFGAMLFLNFTGYLAMLADIEFLPFLSPIISALDIFSRFAFFTNGVVSVADIVYMISFAGVFLFLAQRAIEKRRWSEG